MSETDPTPEESFAWAQEKIAKAKAAGATGLDLNEPKGRALQRLPDEIGELTQLETLVLSNTQVSDLSALRDLSRLQGLYLGGTRVSDLTALTELSGLKDLHLDGTQVSDVSALRHLSWLQGLYVSNTEVSDISALRELSWLQVLYLNRTHVSDLSALRELNLLQRLHLNNTHVSDLYALRDLSGLQGLYLNHTKVSDLSVLRDLSQLQGLTLIETQVSDLSALSELSELQELDLEKTQVLDLLPLAGLSQLDRFWFEGTPAATRDDKHRTLAAIGSGPECAKQVLQYLNGEHPEFGGPPKPYRAPITPFEFASQDKAGIQFEIEGYSLKLDVHSDPPEAKAEKLLPELHDSVEDLIDTFENPNSVMARGILRRAKRMRTILETSAASIADEAVVLWQISVALGSYMDEHALAVADGADPLDRLSASRMGALQRVIEASSVFVRLFPAAEALDESRGGFLFDAYGPDRIRAFIDQTAHQRVLDAQSAEFINALAQIAGRQGPQGDKARSVTMTGIGSLIRIVGHYGKGAIAGIALGVGASVGGEIDAEFELGVNSARMLREGEQIVRAVLQDLAPDVRASVKVLLEEIFGSNVPLPPPKP